MLITVLESPVAEESAARLVDEYRAAIDHLDEGIEETFLARAASTDTWVITTVWRDRAALDAVRRSGQTPRGVLIFRAVGAEPVLTVYEVEGHASAAEAIDG